jgi:cyclophilin family peptidyl-prolyl cis-trans isomerase
MSNKRSNANSHSGEGSGVRGGNVLRVLCTGNSNTSSTTPSANASHDGGRGILRDTTSVLSHRLCLPLLYYLNESDITTDNPGGIVSLPLHRRPIAHSSEYDSIFSNAWRDLQHEEQQEPFTENDLTTKIVDKINSIQNSPSFTAKSQFFITGTSTGYIDILLKKQDDGNNDRPVMIMEFGIGHKHFYKKLDQINNYLQNIRFDEHILMAVVTIEEVNTVDTVEEVNTGTTSNNNYTSMNTGLFFCENDNDPSRIRKTLLWKSSSVVRDNDDKNGVTSSSKLFGKLLNATENYIHWTMNKSDDEPTYQYFSSNCCKIGDQV